MKHKTLAVSKESNVVNTHQIHIYHMNEKWKSANKRQGKNYITRRKWASQATMFLGLRGRMCYSLYEQLKELLASPFSNTFIDSLQVRIFFFS